MPLQSLSRFFFDVKGGEEWNNRQEKEREKIKGKR
jgi:hypothetical protein